MGYQPLFRIAVHGGRMLLTVAAMVWSLSEVVHTSRYDIPGCHWHSLVPLQAWICSTYHGLAF